MAPVNRSRQPTPTLQPRATAAPAPARPATAPAATAPAGWTPTARPAARPAPAAPSTTAAPARPATTPAVVAPPPPKEASPATRAQAARDAQTLHEALRGGLTGLGTDEDKLFSVLQNRSPEQLSAARDAYQQHFRRSLDADVKSDLSGRAERRAVALLSGDHATATAERLAEQTLGLMSDNPAEIMSTLENVPHDVLQQAATRFQALNGTSLEAALRRALPAAREPEALAFAAGRRDEAYAHRVAAALTSGKGAEAVEVLQRIAPEQLGRFAETYQARVGRPLAADVGKLPAGHAKDQGLALLRGDRALADAVRLRQAVEGKFLGFGKDATGALAVLEGRPVAERAAVASAYQRQYGVELGADLRARFGGRDEERLTRSLAGRLGDVDRLQIAMQGFGADSQAIQRVLGGRTRAEAQTLASNYLVKTGRHLESDLRAQLGGRDQFEALLALEGKPETPAQAVEVARRRRDFERAGFLNSASRVVMDLVSDSGSRLDGTVTEAERTLRAASADGVVTTAEAAELSALTTLADGDAAAYRSAKDSATEAAATVAAVGVAVATGGAGAPLIAAAAGGAATKVAVKGAMSGRAYSTEAALTDATIGAVESLSGGLAGRVAPAATMGARALQGATRGAATAFANSATATALKDETWNSGLGEGLFNVTSRASVAAAQGAATGAAQSFAKDLLTRPQPTQLGVAPTQLPEGPVDLSRYDSDDATRAALRSFLGESEYQNLRSIAEGLKASNPALANVHVDDLVALRAYTGSYYTAMNQALRGRGGDIAQQAAIIKTAASALNDLPEFQGTTFRGTTLDAERIARYAPGTVIAEKGFMSTTTAQDVAFSGNVRFVINSKGAGRSVEALSQFANEKEVLFGPGTEFKVLSNAIDQATGLTTIFLDEVP
ncbi:MAG: ADP-ribosyltransferase [Myxococcaceae bacterium]|nr:ADP-ribosyltransferase [Myxococcaceae bacterium]